MDNERQTPRPLVNLLAKPYERQAEVDKQTLLEGVAEERVHRVVVAGLVLALELLSAVADGVEVDLHASEAVGGGDELELAALDKRLLCALGDALLDRELLGGGADLLVGLGFTGRGSGMAHGAEGGGAVAALASVAGLALGHGKGARLGSWRGR